MTLADGDRLNVPAAARLVAEHSANLDLIRTPGGAPPVRSWDEKTAILAVLTNAWHRDYQSQPEVKAAHKRALDRRLADSAPLWSSPIVLDEISVSMTDPIQARVRDNLARTHSREIRRAAELMDLDGDKGGLMERFYMPLSFTASNEPDSVYQYEVAGGIGRETDASLIARNIASGQRTQIDVQGSLMPVIVRKVLLEQPGISAEQMASTLHNSVGMALQLARLSVEQASIVELALALPPELEGVVLSDEAGIHPRNLIFDVDVQRVRFRKAPEDFLVHQPSGAERVGDFATEGRGRAERQGCPARVVTEAGGDAPVQRGWAETVNRSLPIFAKWLPKDGLEVPQRPRHSRRGPTIWDIGGLG